MEIHVDNISGKYRLSDSAFDAQDWKMIAVFEGIDFEAPGSYAARRTPKPALDLLAKLSSLTKSAKRLYTRCMMTGFV